MYVPSLDICPDHWTYFKGYCYRKVASCESWHNSQGRCATLGANLPSIHSQEENVYVQNLHGGEHAWLGLSDINTEGKFVWSDGTPFDFHYWAKQQPNNFHNQDCVHTLGLRQDHLYRWNDVNCSECHKFTCMKGVKRVCVYVWGVGVPVFGSAASISLLAQLIAHRIAGLNPKAGPQTSYRVLKQQQQLFQ